jgi:hypothetical protein
MKKDVFTAQEHLFWLLKSVPHLILRFYTLELL